MYFPPLQPLNNSQYHVSGDVKIDPSAAIAPGVLLQAELDSRIMIAAGVCIGMGTIVHAIAGTVAVEYGASLGAGVLIVGFSKIGANACVGSMTTIINSDIEQGKVVAPGSLLGDDSRKLSKDSQNVVVTSVAEDTAIAGSPNAPETAEAKVKEDTHANTPAVQASINSAVARNASANKPPINDPVGNTQAEVALTSADDNSNSDTPSVSPAEAPAQKSDEENQAIVYGQEQLEQLMGTLFPHNKSWRKKL
ncbi:MAG: transferase [Hormoscilla sp.]